MPLVNKTKGKIIEQKVRFAKNFFSQVKGLMFTSKKSFDYALVFPLPHEGRFSASIHCFFVFFHIDVLYLDRDKKVVDIRRNIMPFTPFDMPKKPAKYFVELLTGKSKGVEIGDQLEWE